MDDLAIALAVAKSSSLPWFVNNYAGGSKTIVHREPNDRTAWYIGIRSWDFAKAAGCSTAVARRRLSALVGQGMIEERRGNSGIRLWAPKRSDADRIAREFIAELRAEGLPFDDEWRAAGFPKTWPVEVSRG